MNILRVVIAPNATFTRKQLVEKAEHDSPCAFNDRLIAVHEPQVAPVDQRDISFHRCLLALVFECAVEQCTHVRFLRRR